MTRSRITHRLRSLTTLELLNIPLQYVVWFHLVALPTTAPNLIGYALFALLLLQGAAYWHLKLRQRPRSALPGARWFTHARRWNVPLLTAGVLYTTWSLLQHPGANTVPGLVFTAVAVLEYVNYFHTQLMYDTAPDLRYLLNHGLRRSHLSRDLSRQHQPADGRLPGRSAT
ncbi:hypothetical protein ACXJJ3_33685 [Kribbella sp. WER1]